METGRSFLRTAAHNSSIRYTGICEPVTLPACALSWGCPMNSPQTKLETPPNARVYQFRYWRWGSEKNGDCLFQLVVATSLSAAAAVADELVPDGHRIDEVTVDPRPVALAVDLCRHQFVGGPVGSGPARCVRCGVTNE